MSSRQQAMSPQPPPPPPLQSNMGDKSSTAKPHLLQSPLRQTPSLERGDRNQVSANLLSSQKFKDELAVRQASLSPNPDSKLSIDERIRMRKENSQEQSRRLPDKLINSSTLQRDKRPFAYSPDVNDPNNRGKLDLSQIKSPLMRRRLIANMEESQDDNDDEERQVIVSKAEDTELDASILESESPMIREHVDIRLLDTELDQRHPTYEMKLSPRNHSSLSQIKPPNEHKSFHQDRFQFAHSPIVHYKEPPTFYVAPQTNQQLTGSNVPSATRYSSSRTDYLDSLDAEIADSLESLSLLANTLESTKPNTPKEQQVSFARGLQVRDGNSRQRLNNSQYDVDPSSAHRIHQTPSRVRPPLRSTRVSTFLPTTSDHGQRLDSERTRSFTDHHATPRFYSTLPSGRHVADYPTLGGSTSNYFGASPGSLGPYSISPYYGSPLDVDEPYTTNPAQLNNKTTSHGTFCRNQNSSHASRYNRPMNNCGVNEPLVIQRSHIHHQAPVQTAQQCPRNLTNLETATCRSGVSGDMQIRDLREMTAKLDREVDRLFNLDIMLRNR